MADIPASSTAVVGAAPLSEDVFLDDRRAFWSFFTGLVFKAAVAITVLLIVLAYFLV